MKKILLALLLLPSLLFAEVKEVSVTPVIETSAYATGDVITPLMEFANITNEKTHQGLVQSIRMSDEGAEGEDVVVVVFRQNPTNTTFTVNDPLTLADADLDKIACIETLFDHTPFVNNGLSVLNNVGCTYNSHAANSYDQTESLWAVALAGNAVTYDAVDALIFTLGSINEESQ